MNRIDRVQTTIRCLQPQKPESGQEKTQSAQQASEKPEQKTGIFGGQQGGGSSSGNQNGKLVSSSSSQDSPGQLAVMLTNARSPLEVQQVISKATMAMLGLKMRQSTAEGKEKEKITAQIRRMEKLLTRSRNKIKQLRKEEDLERRQRKAEKEQQEQKAQAAGKELKQRRSRRKNDESSYARSEVAKDLKENQAFSASELPLFGAGAASGAPLPDLGAIVSCASVSGADLPEAAVSLSIDISV